MDPETTTEISARECFVKTMYALLGSFDSAAFGRVEFSSLGYWCCSETRSDKNDFRIAATKVHSIQEKKPSRTLY